MIDPAMIPDFIDEVQKHLDEFESCLVKLVDVIDDPESINASCRAVHAVTGKARLAGVKNIAELSLRLENLFEQIRQGEKRPDPEMLELLTAGRSRLMELVDNLRTIGAEKADIGDILAGIDKYENMSGQPDEPSSADAAEQSHTPAVPPGHEGKEDEETGFTENFNNLFSDFEEDEVAFAEDTEVPAAFAGDEDERGAGEQELPAAQDIPLTDTRQQAGQYNPSDKLSASPADVQSKAGNLPGKTKTFHDRYKIDIATLRSEIESEAHDEELHDIFIKQLQDNISLLSSLRDNFEDAPDKSQVVAECSELISRLHSSANYMGYDRLTGFYGQWIAELEMAGMDISSGSPASFAFMDRNINTIVELFPQIEETSAALDTRDTDMEEPTSQPAAPSHIKAAEKEEEIPEDESEPALFSDLFSTLDVTDEDTFAEDNEVIAAFAGEDPLKTQDTEQLRSIEGDAPLNELDQKLDYFFADENEKEIPPAETDSETGGPAKKSLRSDRLMTDAESLKKEIEEEEYDKELFQIFIQQLHENISLLRSLADEFPQAVSKTSLIKRCSDLLTALHSSANYMGYERLTEFYGQWIAELEMVDMQLFIGVQASMDFMYDHIGTITDIFPQIQGKAAEFEPDRQFPAEIADAMDFPAEEREIPAGEDFEPVAAISDSGEQITADEEDEDALDEVPISAGDSLADADARRNELFARLSGALESLSEISPAQPDEDETPADLPRSGPIASQEEDRDLFDRLSSALEADTEIQPYVENEQAFAEQTEQKLFDRLSNALDEQGIALQGAGTKSIDDVLSEILTGRGLAATDFIPAEPTRSEMDELTYQHAMERSVEADRRLILSDRRRGPEDRRLTDPLAPAKLRGSIRVDTDKIDNLMNQVEELIVSRSNISQLYHEMGDMQKYLHETARLNPEELRPLRDYADRLNEANTALGRVFSEIQEGVLNVRMMPVAHLFKRYPRFIKDMVRHTNKKVKFTIRGEETELDKMILEEISGSLVHIIGNCIEHGIETTGERKSAGKDETANLLIEAYPESNAVVIEISDDGRGIDPQMIKEKAQELNLLPPEKLESMTGPELTSLIMSPGFSTASQTSTSPARGDGMDEVRKNIENLNGTIDIRSQVGVGTLIHILIPLAVSVIKALAVRVGAKIITIPLTNIVELTRVRRIDITETDGIELIQHRDTPLPVFRLSEILNLSRDSVDSTHEYIVVVKAKGQRAGLIVDGVMRPREAVVKPLVEYLKTESGFSGATVRDDGTISLVLDISSLLAIVKNRMTDMQQKTALECSLKGLAVA